MIVRLNPAALRQITWQQYMVRFLMGGIVTALAGLIAKKFGAGIGGLFLAYPAILPATVTLVEKHERQRKGRLGLSGAKRGRVAASLEAVGTSRGSIGLFAFASLVWELLPEHSASLVLAGSAFAWLAISFMVWQALKARRRKQMMARMGIPSKRTDNHR